MTDHKMRRSLGPRRAAPASISAEGRLMWVHCRHSEDHADWRNYRAARPLRQRKERTPERHWVHERARRRVDALDGALVYERAGYGQAGTRPK